MKKVFKFVFVLMIFVYSVGIFSQEGKISQNIIDESCNCIAKINYNLVKKEKNDSIKSCIINNIIKDQTKQYIDLVKKTLDSLKLPAKDTVFNIGDNTISIVVDKDYDEIQEILLKDCPYLKDLVDIDNEEHENSYSKNKKALEFYNIGEKYFNQSKYDLALVEFNKAVKVDQKFAFAWDNLGICYRKLSRYNEAIECYKKSLEIDPKGTVPLMNMAVAYDLLGKSKKAIETYNEFIQLHPEDPEGFYGISRLQNFSKEYENALENAFKAFKLYDKMGSPYAQDAINVVKEIIDNLRKEKNISVYNNFAEKHGLTKIKE